MSNKNYYDILEVSPRASTAVIHSAWRELSRQYGDGNPDRRLLNEAYEILSDPAKRRAFDESLKPPTGKIKRIGNYRIIEKIAEGGFGATYRAVHELLGEQVCIKHPHMISSLDEALMLEEAKSIWDLRHWSIPAIRDVIRLPDGNVAIVMSYVAGTDLQKAVENKGAIEPEHVCWITERVLNGLLYLHNHKVIHGDIKPGNIIVQPDTHQVVLVDYGLSLVRPRKDTANKGYTPMFASPEQLQNKPLLPESDLYSLGLTMIYALGGDPASGSVPPSTPAPVCDFIKRLIRRDINARPNWKSENLCKTISDVRLQAFGNRASNMKPLTL